MANPFENLPGVTVDGQPPADEMRPQDAAGPQTPVVDAAPGGPPPGPELDEHARAALRRVCGTLAVEPFAAVAFVANNAAWIDAAEMERDELGAALFDLGDVLGWWRDGGALPPWVFPTLALLSAGRRVATAAMTAPVKPLRKPKKDAPANTTTTGDVVDVQPDGGTHGR